MVNDEITISNDSQAARMLREVLPGGRVSASKVEKILSDWALNQMKERKRKELEKIGHDDFVSWHEVKAELQKT